MARNAIAEKMSKPAGSESDDHQPLPELLQNGAGSAELMLPGDKKVSALSDQSFAAALASLNVDGASERNTRVANEAVYREFVMRMFYQAGKEAVDKWSDENADYNALDEAEA